MAFENMDKVGKEYTNGEITVVWKPRLCDHSAVCISELPTVFDSIKRPWVKITGAPSNDIMTVVDRCPTKALTWYKNGENKNEKKPDNEIKSTTVRLMKNGPVLISGDIKVLDEDGNQISCGDRVSICRCDKSKILPFCDGSHREKR